jgi:ABC-2 type transport system permease protein
MIRGAVAIFTRDFKKFLSNPFAILMTLFMPIMYLIIFGNAMGGTITGIPVAVVQDSPYLEYSPLFNTVEHTIRYWNSTKYSGIFDLTIYPDESTAKNALNEGKVSGVIIIPSEIDPAGKIRLYEDSSEYVIPGIIESALRSAIVMAGAANPVQIVKIYGDIEYIQFFGVGVIVMAIFMTTMMGGGIALIRDREMGIIEGYLVTPVKRSSIILGMIGSGTIRAFLAGFIIFTVAVTITGIEMKSIESYFLVFFVLIISSLGITSLMVSFASRFSNQQEYAASSAFINLLLFMTSGAFYPVMGMPDWLRWITIINPEAYAVHSLRSIILRGQGLDIIGIDIMALCIFTGLTMMLGVVSYRRTLE